MLCTSLQLPEELDWAPRPRLLGSIPTCCCCPHLNACCCSLPPIPLQVIAGRPNVCKQLHMPAQSGSSAMLERMRRG